MLSVSYDLLLSRLASKHSKHEEVLPHSLIKPTEKRTNDEKDKSIKKVIKKRKKDRRKKIRELKRMFQRVNVR